MKQHINIKTISSAIMVSLLFILPVKLLAQRPELIIPATHSANSVIISPDDKWLVSASAEGIKIWENKTSKLIKNLAPGSKDNARFSNGEICMAVDAQSKMLALQVADTIYFFDFEKFSFTNKLKVNGRRSAFIFSADGKTLYTGGAKNDDGDNFVIQKIKTDIGVQEELMQTLVIGNASLHYINKLSISPNGNNLLVYDAVMGSWLLDLATNKIKKEFKPALNYFPYSYLPNGNLLALSGKKEKVLFLAELDATSYLPLRKSKTLFKDADNYNAAQYTNAYPSATGKMLFYYNYKAVMFDAADFSISTQKYFSHQQRYSIFKKQRSIQK